MDTPLPMESEAIHPFDWMRSEGLTYQKLADTIGLSSATQARRYVTGERFPLPPVVTDFYKLSGGTLTPYSFHRAWWDYKAKSSSQSDDAQAGAAAP